MTGRIILCGSGKDEPDYTGVNSPTGKCKEHGPYMYYCSDCHDEWKKKQENKQ